MAFTYRTTSAFGEVLTASSSDIRVTQVRFESIAELASDVRVTQVRFEVIMSSVAQAPKRQSVFQFWPINS